VRIQLALRTILICGLMTFFVGELSRSALSDRDALAAYPPGMNGKIAFQSSRDGDTDIWLMNGDGSGQTNLTPDDHHGTLPRWSPDGTQIAYEVRVTDDNYDAWVMNADGSGKTQLTNGPGIEGGPVWSPDGTKILYYDGDDIWQIDSDGSNPMLLIQHTEFDCCAEWSPDGSTIFFDSRRDGDRHIWLANADGTNPIPQPGSIHLDLGVKVSPDGQMLVFYNSGDIYTMNIDGTDRQNITNNGFNEHSPAWTADGTRILYTSEEFGATGQIVSINPDGTDKVNLSNSAGYDSEADMQVKSPPMNRIWGDVNCSGTADPIDSLLVLRHDAGLSVSVAQGCPQPDAQVSVDGIDRLYADSDCAGDVNPIDSLKLLRFDAGLSVNQEEGCPLIGSEVLVAI
jgi:Tol biopolymer transport system component